MFTRNARLSTFAALALGVALTVPTAAVGTANRTNHLTFSGAVRLPGVTLAAGTYVFERLDATNPDVIVVRSADRTKLHYLGLTLRTARPAGLPRDRLVTFGEVGRGEAPPITAWYPVGEQLGHAFFHGSR
jgi:hypothetical protein